MKDKLQDLNLLVAPPVGAWIEIFREIQKKPAKESLPPWERGLKLLELQQQAREYQSLPPWERGLKFLREPGNGLFF